MHFAEKYIFLFLMCVIGQKTYAQLASCRCNTTNQVTICYLSVSDYCYGNPGCNHALDGDFMKDYLVPKLLNKSNFGVNGIASCQMNLKKMSNLNSVKQINDAKCDIFMVGSFAIDTLQPNFQVNSDKTSVPKRVLNYIRNWSMQCESNLVIVAQAEAEPWGYTIQNQNQNPNTAIEDPAKFNIYNGPFGSLTSFSQGGSYQGVITKTPATGSLILAKDLNNRPTVAFDVITNDFILGDIGILCGQAGNLSYGSLINQNNSNDKLAGNMFALGCNITKGNKFTDEDVFICQGISYTLPNGKVVNKEQVVADSFKLENGCDSVHYYKVFLYDQESSALYKSLCEDDTSKYVFDNGIFDKSNPMGIGKLKNRNGCDSIITVNLVYNNHTKANIIDYPCIGVGYQRIVGKDIYDELNTQGVSKIKNAKGCDSTVTVKLNFVHPDTTRLLFTKCRGDSVTYDGKAYAAGAIYSIKYKAINPCDSIVLLTIDTFPASKISIPNEIRIQQYKPYVFQNKVNDDIIGIEWEPQDGLSCLDCINPTFNVATFPSTFAIKLSDVNGCLYRFNINAIYRCGPQLPNVFAPLSSSGNDKVGFSSTCPINKFSVAIYDRWGNAVYRSNDAQQSWDGRLNGQLLLAGVYTYVVKYEDLDGKMNVDYGNVTLVR